jgi:hypothetical protein
MASGGAVERLHRALVDALENILDPNTPAKKTRTITLKITIKPHESREVGELLVETKFAPVPPKPLETSIVIDRDNSGRACAVERMTGEARSAVPLPDLHPDGKIATLKRKEA